MDCLTAATFSPATRGRAQGWSATLNGPWHRPALLVFLAVVIAHWVEHVFQADQVYVLGMPPHMAMGALGMLYPWLVHSEWLHFGYAIVMFAGLFLLRHGFAGRADEWWRIALWIQGWHLVEHTLLLVQASLGHPFWGRPVPTSVLQLVFPRLELHLFYNTVVFVPMVIAMLYHRRPSAAERAAVTCTCARHLPARAAAA
jgi:hypothetical protein